VHEVVARRVARGPKLPDTRRALSLDLSSGHGLWLLRGYVTQESSGIEVPSSSQRQRVRWRRGVRPTGGCLPTDGRSGASAGVVSLRRTRVAAGPGPEALVSDRGQRLAARSGLIVATRRPEGSRDRSFRGARASPWTAHREALASGSLALLPALAASSSRLHRAPPILPRTPGPHERALGEPVRVVYIAGG